MWVDVLALVVATCALGWSIVQGRRSAVAVEREERRREEEIAALRAQLERQSNEEREARSALLTGETAGSSGSARGVAHPTRVRNVGRAVARDVVVWLTLDDEGWDPGLLRPVSDAHRVGTLVPGDPESTFDLVQPEPFPGGRVGRTGLIVASWSDGNGEQVAAIGKVTVFV